MEVINAICQLEHAMQRSFGSRPTLIRLGAQATDALLAELICLTDEQRAEIRLRLMTGKFFALNIPCQLNPDLPPHVVRAELALPTVQHSDVSPFAGAESWVTYAMQVTLP